MKSINTLFVLAAFAIAGSSSFAQTADVSGVTAGTPATAASINALVEAINSLQGRVDTLEADVETLGAAPADLTVNDLVGAEYCISFFGNLAGTNPEGNFARVSSYIGSGVISITSTTLGSLTVELDREFELGWNLGFDEFFFLESSLGAYDWVNGPVPEGESADGSGPFPVTVNSLANGILSLTFGGEGGDVENFNISQDGDMLLSSNFSSDTEEGETNLIIGMRCQ